MLFGRPGSGKSTYAYALSKATGLPLYHLDKHFYVQNWVERDYQEFLAIQKELGAQDSWVIDGNNTQSLELRWARADTVLYFNYPRWRCYWRVLKRCFTKDARIDDRAENCPETISLKLLRYMWSFEQRVAMRIEALRKQYPDVHFYEIRSDKELEGVSKELILS